MYVYNVDWEAKTAGPSLDGFRTELFLLGCDKAKSGNPCQGCFNQMTWDRSTGINIPVQDVFATVHQFSRTKDITIGGGEPLDQIDELIELSRKLKQNDYHIMVYTWRNVEEIIRNQEELSDKIIELMQYVDMIVDGEYKQDDRRYKQDAEDGCFNSIGSGNQVIWSKECKNWIGYALRDICALAINQDGYTINYAIKDNAQKKVIVK